MTNRPAVFSTKFWYSADGSSLHQIMYLSITCLFQITGDTLDAELSNWLADVKPTDEDDYAPPVPGCKAIIAPYVLTPVSSLFLSWIY
jgi:hypothetical protein